MISNGGIAVQQLAPYVENIEHNVLHFSSEQ
jgi:hypothetical protein